MQGIAPFGNDIALLTYMLNTVEGVESGDEGEDQNREALRPEVFLHKPFISPLQIVLLDLDLGKIYTADMPVPFKLQFLTFYRSSFPYKDGLSWIILVVTSRNKVDFSDTIWG